MNIGDGSYYRIAHPTWSWGGLEVQGLETKANGPRPGMVPRLEERLDVCNLLSLEAEFLIGDRHGDKLIDALSGLLGGGSTRSTEEGLFGRSEGLVLHESSRPPEERLLVPAVPRETAVLTFLRPTLGLGTIVQIFFEQRAPLPLFCLSAPQIDLTSKGGCILLRLVGSLDLRLVERVGGPEKERRSNPQERRCIVGAILSDDGEGTARSLLA